MLHFHMSQVLIKVLSYSVAEETGEEVVHCGDHLFSLLLEVELLGLLLKLLFGLFVLLAVQMFFISTLGLELFSTDLAVSILGLFLTLLSVLSLLNLNLDLLKLVLTDRRQTHNLPFQIVLVEF